MMWLRRPVTCTYTSHEQCTTQHASWRPSMTIQAVNPTTGETINTYTEMAPAQVARAIAQAHDAFLSWRQTSLAERAHRMHQAAKLLRDQATAYALLMAQERGKPAKDGRAEVEKCPWVCYSYAEPAAECVMR